MSECKLWPIFIRPVNQENGFYILKRSLKKQQQVKEYVNKEYGPTEPKIRTTSDTLIHRKHLLMSELDPRDTDAALGVGGQMREQVRKIGVVGVGDCL